MHLIETWRRYWTYSTIYKDFEETNRREEARVKQNDPELSDNINDLNNPECGEKTVWQ